MPHAITPSSPFFVPLLTLTKQRERTASQPTDRSYCRT
jgi:hypothetical protein